MAIKDGYCSRCQEKVNESLRFCTVCAADLGFPNVRAANTDGELQALNGRFEVARREAVNRGVGEQFEQLVMTLEQNSHVVVAMPPFAARNFVSDSRNLYQGYERLVGSEMRAPAPSTHDSDRQAVSGKLFGSYASEIKYGVLSLNGESLANYGLVYLTLRDLAIRDRVSFLHENSYLFADQLGTTLRGSVPPGFRSDWNRRSQLATTKLQPGVSANESPSDWASRLVQQGKDRSGDSCIEAHIFGTFSVGAIQSASYANSGASRQDRLDIQIVQELMQARSATGANT